MAPTTGGPVWIERIRARPRLQASYAALKGDFRPLALAADYHNFVSGPLAAHGLAEGAYELLISDDIDSGRSWEIPVLIAHLLAVADQLQEGDAAPDEDAPHAIIWATGSVDPELHPQVGDYAIAQKCALAAPLFDAWGADRRNVRIIVPAGLDEAERQVLADVAGRDGFSLTEAADFDQLRQVVGLSPETLAEVATPQTGQLDELKSEAGAPSPVSAKWRPALVGLAAIVAGLAIWFAADAFRSVPSNGSATTDVTEGIASQITLQRLGAASRADCIERIMQTQPMERTAVVFSSGQFRVPAHDGLCGLRFTNQSSDILAVRLSGDLANAAIQGNDALFQGIELAVSDTVDLIFSRHPKGLTASLHLNDAVIPVAIDGMRPADN